MNPSFDERYFFCKFRIPTAGGRVIWEITNECNYGCKYCIFSSTGKKPAGELTTCQVLSTIDQLKSCNFNHIKFTGGEPFIREDMIDILHHASQQKMSFDISTNASMISAAKAKALQEVNLSMIHVSLDGDDITSHEAVRGKKSFTPTITGIHHLIEHHIKLRIGCVIHAFNERRLEKIVQYCHQLGAHEIIFSMMEPVGRLKGKNFGLATRKPHDLQKEIAALSQAYHGQIMVSSNLGAFEPKPIQWAKPQEQSSVSCPGASKFLFINSTGNVWPCTWLDQSNLHWFLGNIKIHGIDEMLKSPQIVELAHRSMTPRGVQCPAQTHE